MFERKQSQIGILTTLIFVQNTSAFLQNRKIICHMDVMLKFYNEYSLIRLYSFYGRKIELWYK